MIRTLGFVRPLLALSVVLASLALVGCGESRDQSLVGSWEMQAPEIDAPDMSEAGGMPEGMPGDMADMMADMMAGQMSMTLTLNEDGTFSSRASVMGQTITTSGTWTTSGGDTITLEATEASGDAEPQAATGSYTATRITITDDEGGDVGFVRESASAE